MSVSSLASSSSSITTEVAVVATTSATKLQAKQEVFKTATPTIINSNKTKLRRYKGQLLSISWLH